MMKAHEPHAALKSESTMRLDIDLRFSKTIGGEDGQAETSLSGNVTAAGRHITVTIDDEDSVYQFSGGLEDLVREVADELAAQHLSLTVCGQDGDELLSVGDLRVPLWQRGLTRSRHLRVGSLRAASRIARERLKRGRRRRDQPADQVFPPITLLPLLPTVMGTRKRPVTTTHHTRGSGNPRLLLVQDQGELGFGPPLEFLLHDRDSLVIGSADHCDLQLTGIAPQHAEIIHDEFDEYVLRSYGAVSGSFSGGGVDEVTLRTGSRIHLGPWRMVFSRAEFADHGRPFGGRQEGEFGYQRPQYNPYTDRIGPLQ